MELELAYRTPVRDDLLAIMAGALDAVEPFAAVSRALQREGSRLDAGGQRYDLDDFEKIWVVGAGKAGAPMAQAVEAILGDRISGGVVVVKYDHRLPLAQIELREAGHPVPDQAGLSAGRAIREVAEQASERDLVICLLSGGGSALLESLPPPLTLETLRATTEALLASGATINELNAVRKHLSLLKGGQLARAAAPATLLTLVLSDVVGSPLDVIASGPTVPDRSTWQAVGRIVARYRLAEQLPAAVRERLAKGQAGELPETAKPGEQPFDRAHILLVADNGVAAEAARRAATASGYRSELLTTFLEGEAREVARVAVALGREIRTHSRPLAPPACLILGGETTVTLDDAARSGRQAGKGGRNQELALAAAIALAGQPGITVGALATDGTDGPTDSAGAVVDGSTVQRATDRGFEALHHLSNHDAYPLLASTGDLLRSGPTRTNVNDLLFIMVEQPRHH